MSQKSEYPTSAKRNDDIFYPHSAKERRINERTNMNVNVNFDNYLIKKSYAGILNLLKGVILLYIIPLVVLFIILWKLGYIHH